MNENELTIQRIRKHKSDLEKDIMSLICAFEEETCCIVSDISMSAGWTVGGTHVIEEVVTTVRL